MRFLLQRESCAAQSEIGCQYLVDSNGTSILNVINMESFVNTPISITVISDSIQQQFATSHTKITCYLHHMKAVPNVIHIRRKGIH
jgi:hypothetical protein